MLELWIGFGTGKDIKIYQFMKSLKNLVMINAWHFLSFFRAFTGCDVTSSMVGTGKKTGWTALQSLSEVTNTMITLTENPIELREDSTHMHLLERLTVLMYSKACSNVTKHDSQCLHAI